MGKGGPASLLCMTPLTGALTEHEAGYLSEHQYWGTGGYNNAQLLHGCWD